MAVPSLTSMQPFPAALSGTWKLAAGRAVTLQPREAGVLRVAHGGLWATGDGPHAGPLNDLGDQVLAAGAELRLRAGQRLVLEAWDRTAPAYFSWDPQPVTVRSRAPRLASVTQPLSELRLAFALGAGAAGRLLAGLAGIARDLALGRRDEGFAVKGACASMAR